MDSRASDGTGIDRRAFLGSVAGAAAVAALTPGRGWAQETDGHTAKKKSEPKWKMKLSTSSIQFSSLPVEEACRRIAALGFSGVDIWCAYQGCGHLDDCLERLGAKGLAALLKETKLELTAFSTYVGGFAKYAKLLGEAGGGVAVQGSAAPCEPSELTGRMKKFFEELKPLVELAEETDTHLAIENHGHALLDSLDSFKAFVDLNPSRRLGIALAPYHLQAIEASTPKAIEICGKQLFFFYAWENAPELKQLPGHGPTDFQPWIEALAKIDYPRFVNPFMHGHPEPEVMTQALAKSKGYLAECVKKLEAAAAGK